MCSFEFKKNETIKKFIKDRLIIRATTTGMFCALKAANITQTKSSLDAMGMMKLSAGIYGGVLVRDFTKNGSLIAFLNQYSQHSQPFSFRRQTKT